MSSKHSYHQIGVLILSLGLLATRSTAQNITSLQEYPARPILESVIVADRSPALQPIYLIYPEAIVSYPDWKQTTVNLLELYINRAHTQFVIVALKGSPPPGRRVASARSWSSTPLYCLADRWDYASYCRAENYTLSFYDVARQLVKTYELPRATHEINLPALGAFSRRGKYLVFFRPLTQLDRRRKIPELYYFLGNGTRLWETQLPLEQTRALGISNNGQHLIVSGSLLPDSAGQSPQMTLLMDSTAQILASYPFSFTCYHFRSDDEYLVLTDKHWLSLIYLPRKKLVFRQELGNENRVITDCQLIGADKLLVATGVKGYIGERVIYNDPQLLLFDTAGARLDEMLFPLDYTVRGELLVNAAGNCFGFVFQDRFAVFRISE